MDATIITDASYCDKTGAGGWGFYIASHRGRVPGGGMFKTLIKTSVDAETASIVNAIAYGIKHNLILKSDRILIQNDCMSALERLKKPKGIKCPIVKHFVMLKQKYYLNTTFRHVKGHTTKQDARSITNRCCDKRARQEMNRMRQLIELGKIKRIMDN